MTVTMDSWLLWVWLDGQDEPVSVSLEEVTKTPDILRNNLDGKAEVKEEETKGEKEHKEEKEHKAEKEEKIVPPPPPATTTSTTQSTSTTSETPLTSTAAPAQPPIPLVSWPLGRFVELIDQPSVWALEVDGAIIELANVLADELNTDPFDLLYTDLTEEVRAKYPLLHGLDLNVLRARFCVLKVFNKHVISILQFIDRQQIGLHQHNLGRMLCDVRVRRLILSHVKLQLFDQVLEPTTTTTIPAEDPYDDPPSLKTITLNRGRAAKATETIAKKQAAGEKVGQLITHSLLGQAYAQLGSIPNSELRRAFIKITDDSQKRTFKVRFAGEGVNDNGGPYRDCFNDWFNELQSSMLPYFIPAPNTRDKVGNQQDLWIVHPGNTDIEMFRFIGKMMAVAIRSDVHLNVRFPSILWKTLSQEPLTLEDLGEIDQTVVGLFKELQQLEKEPNAELVAEMLAERSISCFEITLGDGTTVVETIPNGKHVPVTKANLGEWIMAALHTRLHEADKQLAGLLQGFGQVVPLSMNAVFSWQELEILVSGSADFSVEVLKSVTKYEGKVGPTLPYIQYFWEVLGEMSVKEKSQFLRFCWARTRCPKRASDFNTKFKIQEPKSEALVDPDSHLPHALTCFFSIQLPPYTSKEALRSKLSYAMWNCGSMNADVNLKDSELYNYMADDLS